MKFRSAILTAQSGSIGGITGSHNRGGMYLRARAQPINPNTPAQQLARSRLALNVASWSSLTEAERVAWNDYALANPISDALGEPRNVGGLGWFIRANSVRRQASLSQISAAPVLTGPVVLTAPAVTIALASTDVVTYSFNNADAWAGEVGGALVVFVSRPQAPTITSFGGPFRFAGSTAGAGTPPTSPGTFTSPFPFAVGQRIFARFVAVRADGRISADAITFQVST